MPDISANSLYQAASLGSRAGEEVCRAASNFNQRHRAAKIGGVAMRCAEK